MNQPSGTQTSPAGTQLEQHVAKVSLALRKYMLAASSHCGGDCYAHAAFGQALLKDRGIETRLTAGHAAWRIGPNDADVIGHTPEAATVGPTGGPGFGYHCWLECPALPGKGFVIDFTTYQLRLKAQMLDASDGGRTVVEWCPDYLLLPRENIGSYREVARTPMVGIAYYEEKAGLDALLNFTFEHEDLRALRLIALNPEGTVVLGPNHWPSDPPVRG